MLDQFAAGTHAVRRKIQAALHRFDHRLVLPPGHPSLDARCALRLQMTGLAAGAIPVAMKGQPLLDGRHMVVEKLAGGATVHVLLSHIDEVLFAEPALSPRARGVGSGHDGRDADRFASQDLFA